MSLASFKPVSSKLGRITTYKVLYRMMDLILINRFVLKFVPSPLPVSVKVVSGTGYGKSDASVTHKIHVSVSPDLCICEEESPK